VGSSDKEGSFSLFSSISSINSAFSATEFGAEIEISFCDVCFSFRIS
jgi:hypothetical protein